MDIERKNGNRNLEKEIEKGNRNLEKFHSYT